MTDEANATGEGTQSERELAGRPDRDRVFYANAVNWFFSEGQEAAIDFKLVMREDFSKTAEIEEKEDDKFSGKAVVNLDSVPVEARIYLPFNQFVILAERMAQAWNTFPDNIKALARTEDDEDSSDG